MHIQIPRPTIFAHRGASAYAPENTLAAFQLAVRQGADAIELDAKLSADGQVMVIHDQTVDRTTNGTGKVRHLSLAALKKLDAGLNFDLEFRDEKIPTLAEVFETVGQQICINVELTNYASPLDDLPVKAARLVQQFNLEERVIFSSFNPVALLKARQVLPAVPAGLLATLGSSGALARSWLVHWLRFDALHPEQNDTTQALVEQMHKSKRRVHTWTVNDAGAMQKLFEWGVDGIITDDPIKAREVLAVLQSKNLAVQSQDTV